MSIVKQLRKRASSAVRMWESAVSAKHTRAPSDFLCLFHFLCFLFLEFILVLLQRRIGQCGDATRAPLERIDGRSGRTRAARLASAAGILPSDKSTDPVSQTEPQALMGRTFSCRWLEGPKPTAQTAIRQHPAG